MRDTNDGQTDQSEVTPDDLERAQTTAADVESAGRSCIVIIGLTIVILVLLALWVLYTTV
jgi:hypothetical protein